MEQIYDTLIIGGGPAGYTAALYAQRAGLNTLLIEKMSVGGQMTLTGDIDNYPGFEQGIDGFTLGMKMQQTAERFGAKTEYAEISGVDFLKDIKKVFTPQKEYLAKTVIIASGANPKPLNLPNEDLFLGKGVHYCAHCDGRFYKDKTVIVVGGGNSAVADALYLSRLVKKVYLVHRRDTLRASKIYHDQILKTENIEILWDTKVQELLTDVRVIGAKLLNTKTNAEQNINCDAVFVSIGRSPATEFLNGAVQTDKNGYIVADESTKTNVKGVFAAGDVRTKTLRQVITAAADGAVAATAAEEYLNEI